MAAQNMQRAALNSRERGAQIRVGFLAIVNAPIGPVPIRSSADPRHPAVLTTLLESQAGRANYGFTRPLLYDRGGARHCHVLHGVRLR